MQEMKDSGGKSLTLSVIPVKNKPTHHYSLETYWDNYYPTPLEGRTFQGFWFNNTLKMTFKERPGCAISPKC